MTGNPVVTLNRAVAAAMPHGPSSGLAVLGEVDERLTGHYRLDAVRAHLMEMAGDRGRAGELPRGCESYDEPSGAALPCDASGATQRRGRFDSLEAA